MYSDTILEPVTALARLEVEVPSMEGTRHLTARNHAIAKERPLVRADPIKNPHSSLVIEDRELLSRDLQR